MWALVDCDNFFCSCERVFRPDLNGEPVVVLSNNDGCVVARSREAKAMGIKMGLPYYQMLEQYPNSGITAFSSNYKLYGDLSARIMAILRDEAPNAHQYSIDEAFLDLQGMDESILKDWGERLAKKIRKWTGVPVSIGIAKTKTLAKVASKFAKKHPGYKKCCFIQTDDQRMKALKLFDVCDVWGIGRRIGKSLAVSGITTAWDFSVKSRQWVKRKYHLPAERTWMELNGYSVTGIDEMEGRKKQSIMTSRSFPEMLTSIDEIKPHVANYAARCAAKLRKQKSSCGVVMVFVQANYFREDLPYYSNSASYYFSTPTFTTTELVTAALEVLSTIFKPGIHYKRAGVMVSDISSGEVIQPDLFDYDMNKSKKYRSISDAMDEINLRLGADTVVLAAQQYPQKDEKGKSVKFSHAIKRAMKSPDYTTSLDAFIVK
ncbi:MAG: Y-family DNA polymerase [Muribaculaceae bacterium]|nr:Y-family DNA polymerase [Muribaculaceae bacterium]